MGKYSELVTPRGYMSVFDGVMETLVDAPSGSPSWAMDSPSAAIRDFLAEHGEFEVDLYYSRVGVIYYLNGFLVWEAK